MQGIACGGVFAARIVGAECRQESARGPAVPAQSLPAVSGWRGVAWRGGTVAIGVARRVECAAREACGMAIERAVVSVYDKRGVVEFARGLAGAGVEILSTGGTAKLLREAGLAVRDVAELTGWPEMLGGRVKTLHPKIHGGILYRRGLAGDREEAAQHGLAAIDLVVVNLYPFEATAAKAELTAEELIENIDIGGPTMLRSAAKNFESVAVVCDPADYPEVAKEMTGRGGRELSLETRLRLARKAFAATSRYD